MLQPIEIPAEGQPNLKTPPVELDVSKFKKEDWINLAKTDPGKYAELTQANFDKLFRESKEEKEKRIAAEQREINLKAEIEQLKKPVQQTQPDNEKVYGGGVYPKTEEEWNDLFLENPTFANDLRNEYLGNIKENQTIFRDTRQRSAKIVQQDHPDMYVTELDESGQPKKDAQGKLILKKDPKNGAVILNPDSEKGKLWITICNEDPDGWNSLKNAPELIMAEMERRLRRKNEKVLSGQNNSNEQDYSGVAGEGVLPPKPGSLKFSSDNEKAHAEAMVKQGVYKSLEEYTKHRDSPDTGYAESNRFPSFSK